MVIESRTMRTGITAVLFAGSISAWSACGALVGIDDLEAAQGPTSPFRGPTHCTVPSDCPLAGNACFLRSCVGEVCALTDAPTGMPVASQLAGDCKQVQCDSVGGTMEVPFGDPFDDGSDCTVDVCDGTALQHIPKAMGTPCQGGVCDGGEGCVECITALDCSGVAFCEENHCVPATCINTMLDRGETDIDCGGGGCPPCDVGQICADGSSCISQICTRGMCAAPSCDDEVTNGFESDVDCGGTCPHCPTDAMCTTPQDCEDGVCGGDGPTPVCVAPTCNDGVTNGGEIDEDCGGPCPPGSCDVGETCNTSEDCLSWVCKQGTCREPDCNDNVQNGDEQGVDCGGSCNPCNAN